MKKFKKVFMAAVLALSVTLMLPAGAVKASAKSDGPGIPAKEARIGISWLADFDDWENPDDEDMVAYMHAVEKAGGVPVLLPRVSSKEEALAALEDVGALVMTGGEDIGPAYYSENPHELLGEVNDIRDVSDYWYLTTAIGKDIPILCTCRGFQFLNIICGGTLYQDIPTEYADYANVIHRDPEGEDYIIHDIIAVQDTKLSDLIGAGETGVRTWHHQGVKTLGDNLAVMGVAADGMIEAADKTDSTYVIGLQFHPEQSIDRGDDSFLPIYEKLVELASE